MAKYRVEPYYKGRGRNRIHAGFAVVYGNGEVKIGVRGLPEVYPRAGAAALAAEFYNRKEGGQ